MKPSASQLLWGIDLGGTKIEGVVLDPAQSARVICRLRGPTDAQLGYEVIIQRVSELVRRLEVASGGKRSAIIGIGTPGVLEPSTGLLKNSNTVCLNSRPLGRDLSVALGVEARLANDANCFALAEAQLGAARGRQSVFGVILGTGVGGGIVVQGRVLTGLHGIAGEWGHNPLRGEATPCYCGRQGCVETVISGPALERFFAERSGEKLRLPEIVARAASGDPHAAATFERLRNKFGEAIAAVINLLDPDAVVLGGGVGNLNLLYEEATRTAVRRHLFNPELRTEFLRPTLGDSAGVFGAAMLAAQ